MSDRDPLTARHVYWALSHLHMAGSRLTSRQHEYIDSIEYELCALVSSRPKDCRECERQTPDWLLDEPGAEGRCPRCRGEAAPGPEIYGKPAEAPPSRRPTDDTNYALMTETYPGLPIEEAFGSFVESRMTVGMLQTAYGTVIQAGARVKGASDLLTNLRKAYEASKTTARTLATELFRVIKAPGELVPGTQLPRAIALGLVAYQLQYEAGLPINAGSFRKTIENLDIPEANKAEALASLDALFGP